MISEPLPYQPDLFNVSIPGESLTEPKGKWPYEKPAEYASPIDAFKYILDTHYDPVTFGNVTKSLSAGVPIELIVDIVVFAGFMEGKFTVDVAELIKPAFFLNLIADARDSGIEPVLFMNIEGPEEMSPDAFMDVMKEFRPEKHAMLMENAQNPVQEIEQVPVLDDTGFVQREI